jgi:hypothetical protein
LRDNGPAIFYRAGMNASFRQPDAQEQAVLDEVCVRLLEPDEIKRCHELLDQHHYLGSLKPVGERLYYVAADAAGHWLALLVFSSPAKHLRHRDEWIGWTGPQRHRRLGLVVNNSRFLLLPGRAVPNLGTKVLRLVLGRLSADWVARYDHPVLVVETFVDPEHFCGTVYTANGWKELGATDGWGRHRRDYYVKHDKPKRLFARELRRNARRSLQAERLAPDLAVVEAKVPPRCPRPVKEIRSFAERLKGVPDFRARIESYPVWSLLTLVLLATLCGAPRGQKDLAKFARGFSQAQLRALGVRRNRQGRYPSPSQSTFCRLLQRVDAAKVDQAILAIQDQMRGPAPKEEIVVFDGKQPKHGGGQSVLTAMSSPSQRYLASAIVDTKTNEIPVAQELLGKMDLESRLVSLDALHTQMETARSTVLEAGGDYLLTAKGNQPTLRDTLANLVSAPSADFPP